MCRVTKDRGVEILWQLSNDGPDRLDAACGRADHNDSAGIIHAFIMRSIARRSFEGTDLAGQRTPDWSNCKIVLLASGVVLHHGRVVEQSTPLAIVPN
jgi:hypothetical protein